MTQPLRLALVWLLATGVSHGGEARERLQRFLDQTRTLSADFVQLRSIAGGGPSERASGRLTLQRPGRFRWDYLQPHQQLILADGEKIWIYDPDLEQVTVKGQRDALTSSPTQLLTGNIDLDARFSIIEVATDDGLAWTQLKPLDGDNEFSEVHLGFDPNGLAAMRMVDSLGYTTLMKFSNLTINSEIDSSIFRFVPPPGVDVVGE